MKPGPENTIIKWDKTGHEVRVPWVPRGGTSKKNVNKKRWDADVVYWILMRNPPGGPSDDQLTEFERMHMREYRKT